MLGRAHGSADGTDEDIQWLKLSLKWKSLRAENEDQLDTRDLVALLQKDAEIMREEEVEQLSRHFRSKIAEARRQAEQGDSALSFHA